MQGIWILVTLTLLLITLGVLERYFHNKRLLSIPVRIHVNGTRGKSSVTRLIASGIRESGMRTCAKTTGTLARMILPDGSEYPIYRQSRPNVIEQVRIVRIAARFQAKALVIECMALQPYLQWLSEARLVRATHAVITNARPDHLDVMGPTEVDVAYALAGMVPVKEKLFTAEQKLLEPLAEVARDRETTLIGINQSDIEAVSDEEMKGFSYIEHKENVALALRVCTDLGIDRKTALQGMWNAKPDPGAMTAHEMDFFGRKIIFVNGFAANDPESTGHLWNWMVDAFPDVEKRIALVNCRIDRPDRSRQLGAACLEWKPADHYILMGTGTHIFARESVKHGMDLMRMVFAEDQDVTEIFEKIVEHTDTSSLVMGIGNIGDLGLDMARHFRNRSRIREII